MFWGRLGFYGTRLEVSDGEESDDRAGWSRRHRCDHGERRIMISSGSTAKTANSCGSTARETPRSKKPAAAAAVSAAARRLPWRRRVPRGRLRFPRRFRSGRSDSVGLLRLSRRLLPRFLRRLPALLLWVRLRLLRESVLLRRLLRSVVLLLGSFLLLRTARRRTGALQHRFARSGRLRCAATATADGTGAELSAVDDADRGFAGNAGHVPV